MATSGSELSPQLRRLGRRREGAAHLPADARQSRLSHLTKLALKRSTKVARRLRKRKIRVEQRLCTPCFCDSERISFRHDVINHADGPGKASLRSCDPNLTQCSFSSIFSSGIGRRRRSDHHDRILYLMTAEVRGLYYSQARVDKGH